METILVNKLPTRTWNRLGVNETALLWDEAGAVDGGTEVLSADGRLELSADAPYARRTVEITAARGQRVTVYEMFRGGDHLHVRTVLRPERGAVIRLVQVQVMDEHAVLRSEVSAHCPEGSSVELYRLLPGRGDTYADDRLTLADGASLKAAMGYLGRKQQVIDLNLAVDHVGRNTRSDIDVSGALSDSAKKVFRGTIDFKNGSAGSTGSEQETVLLLGDDVVNKTVPLILCAEENVEGTHGATIGALDDGAYAAALVRHCGDMGYGPRRAREKLREKGVPQELWDEALDELPPDGEQIDRFLQSKLHGRSPEDKEKKRLTDALLRRGFSWGEVRSAWGRYGSEIWEE